MTLQPENDAKRMLSKVPEITVFFWIIKVLCTTVGETASDFLNVNLGFGLTGTSIVSGIILLAVLFFQFRAKKYIPGLYWLSIVLISIVGTLVTDNMTDAMGIPLEFSTVAFSIALIITFAIWFHSEKTLSIHSITTTKREMFYWLTVLFTFALGTAAGDLMAESLGLGYVVTGLIVCGVVLAVSIAWRLKLDGDLSFWLIYIMTRPLGASLGDYLSQPPKYGGLGLGATITSFVFIGAILLTVVFLSVTKVDRIAKPAVAAPEVQNRRIFFIQAAAVVAVLALAGGTGYYFRHNALQAEINGPSLQAGAQAAASADPQATAQASADPQATAQGTSSSPAASSQASALAASPTSSAQTSAPTATASPAAQLTKLGDLTSFMAIEQDMLNDVNSGKLAAAKTRADDLEYTWDNAEARLKPKDQKTWNTIDKTIDTVLRQVRAVHQDASGCKTALVTSMAAMG